MAIQRRTPLVSRSGEFDFPKREVPHQPSRRNWASSAPALNGSEACQLSDIGAQLPSGGLALQTRTELMALNVESNVV